MLPLPLPRSGHWSVCFAGDLDLTQPEQARVLLWLWLSLLLPWLPLLFTVSFYRPSVCYVFVEGKIKTRLRKRQRGHMDKPTIKNQGSVDDRRYGELALGPHDVTHLS